MIYTIDPSNLDIRMQEEYLFFYKKHEHLVVFLFLSNAFHLF